MARWTKRAVLRLRGWITSEEKNSELIEQKAIFLDRDGTINKYVGFLRDIEDFEFRFRFYVLSYWIVTIMRTYIGMEKIYESQQKLQGDGVLVLHIDKTPT